MWPAWPAKTVEEANTVPLYILASTVSRQTCKKSQHWKLTEPLTKSYNLDYLSCLIQLTTTIHFQMHYFHYKYQTNGAPLTWSTRSQRLCSSLGLIYQGEEPNWVEKLVFVSSVQLLCFVQWAVRLRKKTHNTQFSAPVRPWCITDAKQEHTLYSYYQRSVSAKLSNQNIHIHITLLWTVIFSASHTRMFKHAIIISQYIS